MDRAIVVGGGQSGLAAACALRSHGFEPTVLEAGPEPVGSWPQYYDSLSLLSPSLLNSLPGLPFPGDPANYPSRDEVVDYLRAYAKRLDCDIRTGQRVTSVTRNGAGFVARTEPGEEFRAPVVVAASGNFANPHRPDLGLARFTGTVLHSSEYRSPEPFVGQRVVVVGGGESAVQIAVEVSRHADVTLATRRPVKFTKTRPKGDAVGWKLLRHVGRLPVGKAFIALEKWSTYVIDTGGFRAAFATGKLDRREMFLGGDGAELRWRDGRRELVDAVILGTGYRSSFDYLWPLGAATDRAGRPRHRFGMSTAQRGLAFVGLPGQRALYTMALGGAGWDACYVARCLRRELESRQMRCCARH